MRVLDSIYKDAVVETMVKPVKKIWCNEDQHHLFENYADFNEWIDGEVGTDVRKK